MKASMLLQWQYLIFLLPFGLSALLLLLSSLRFGHHSGHSAHGGSHIGYGAGAGAGHGAAHGHTAGTLSGTGLHGGSAHPVAHAVPGQSGHHSANLARGSSGRNGTREQPNAMHLQGIGGHLKVHLNAPTRAHGGTRSHEHAQSHSHSNPFASLWELLLRLTGIGRAPLVMMLEVFFLVWGFSGYVAVQALAHDALPSNGRVWTATGIALIGGVIGARIAAEIIARVLPPEDSVVVSRDELFGLTGRITFTVSEAEGRIRIYDQYGTLHDEPCRVAPGQPVIEKGRSALVMDRDAQGRLLVESISDVVS